MELKPGYKNTDLGVIPQDWDVVPMGQVGECLIGLTYSPLDVRDFGTLVLRSSNVQNGRLAFNDNVFVDMEIPARAITRKNDILICVRNGSRQLIGKCALIDEQTAGSAFGAFMSVLRSDSAKFLFFQFQSDTQKRQIDEVMGATINQITNKDMAAFKVIWPPTKAEQEAIAGVLSDADALIESLEQLITKKHHIKQGTMQELLRPKPSDEIRLLREVSTLKGRIGWQGLKQTEFTSNEDEPFLITGMNFKDGAIRWNEVYHISESRYEMAKDIQLRTGDLLMTKDGTIGKVLYIDTIPYPGKASLNSHLLLFRPNRESYSSRYLYYQLSSQRFKDFIELSKSGTTFFGLSQAAVGTYPVLLPPLEDQVRVATILSDMDAEIATLENKLAKTRSLKQGMMNNLLTGRIRLVPAVSKATPFPGKKEPVSASTKSHNWQINEAVIIAVLAKHFGSEEYPLARKRCTKLTYLLHRHVERKAEGYLKKAAGPYNPATKYKGPEAIAQKNGYIRSHHNGTYPGFIAAANISQAEAYFQQWYGPDALSWLEQFRRKKTEELELLATVDMAAEDLRCEGKAVKLVAVKQAIHDHPEWEAKLQREIFSDINIVRAIQICHELFA